MKIGKRIILPFASYTLFQLYPPFLPFWHMPPFRLFLITAKTGVPTQLSYANLSTFSFTVCSIFFFRSLNFSLPLRNLSFASSAIFFPCSLIFLLVSLPLSGANKIPTMAPAALRRLMLSVFYLYYS